MTDDANTLNLHREILALQEKVASQGHKISLLRAQRKELRAIVTKRKDREAIKTCPNCSAAFNNKSKVTRAEQRRRLTGVHAMLRRMYPEDYAAL